MTSEKVNITELVLKQLEKFACPPGIVPSIQDHLLEDLDVGEDFLDFVCEIHSQLKIKIPAPEWEKVSTVEDIIILIERYMI